MSYASCLHKLVLENGGAKPGPPRTPEVELAAFSSKVEGIRNLFIENLHLDEEVRRLED